MRIVDIYREDSDSGTGFRLVTENLIQTGENNIVYSCNARTYTMADGSIMMYTSDKDTNQMTVSLECSGSQADSLTDAGHYGKLFFAGLHAGTKSTPTPTDRNYSEPGKTAFAGYLTGNRKIQQIAGNLYSVDLTMQIDFTETQNIPVIESDGLKIDNHTQNFSDFLYGKDGIFHRKQVIYTTAEQISIAFPVKLNGFSIALTRTLSRNGVLLGNADDVHSLQTGCNQFDLVAYDAGNGCKPLRIRFGVIRT